MLYRCVQPVELDPLLSEVCLETPREDVSHPLLVYAERAHCLRHLNTMIALLMDLPYEKVARLNRREEGKPYCGSGHMEAL